jgi:hypothetical protein
LQLNLSSYLSYRDALTFFLTLQAPLGQFLAQGLAQARQLAQARVSLAILQVPRAQYLRVEEEYNRNRNRR